MSENKESCDCVRVPNPLPEDFEVKPGHFSWDTDFKEGHRYLYLCLPGESQMTAIEVRLGGPGGDRVWGWDGNEDKPTVEPSIHWVGHWHGFLRQGRLESV